MSADLSAPVAYRPGGGAAWREPWPSYAALREHDPVHHVVPEGRPQHDHYVLSRHADVLAAAVDVATFSSNHGLTVEYDELERIGLADNPPFVMTDPPVHTTFRKLVARGFTPRQVRELEPVVRAFAVERFERLRDEGGGDVVAELFKPLPSLVVGHYLGVPVEDQPRFDDWSSAIVAANVAAEGVAAAASAADATMELMGYFSELVERRRVEPGEDTVSQLVRADVDLLEILAFVFTMVAGGNDTSTGALGGAVQLLAQRPDQRALLAGDPGLVADAVEEFLRLTSPVQGLARTTTRNVELHGVVVPAGRKVLLLYGAGNRDPRRYGPDADELDVRRAPSQILSFGQGHHHCLGAAAARLQIQVTLEELVRRIPDFAVDEDAITWAPGPYVRRPLALPMTVLP
ncbi:cytochrome P450 [Nocardioides aromaticivorans]|uniref:Cytochrome P450 n=1 Tax=Nocardioides aromaticivorans TaxID=200618 RepID=A0A7Z0CKZ1_9ACTN|nr:cytochrome P450 [Nocardioides aromaticivorans]NYI44684.1 cytochrome P450 [Nocardioides aromaticivorans]